MAAPDLILAFPPMNVQITHPEIGVPQLTAHLRAAGLDVRQHDLNVAFMYRYLADPEVIARFLQEISEASGEETSGMFPGEQVEAIGRAMSRARPPRLGPDVGEDVHAYMDRRAARLNILSNVRDLEPAGTGLHRGVWRALVEMVDGIALQPRSFSERDVLATAESDLPLLERYYDAFLERAFADGEPACFGLSVGSSFQLVPALVLARMVRQRAGGVRIVGGGPWFTAAKDLLPDLGSIARFVDAVVVHEGEVPLLEIMTRLGDGKPIGSIPGVAVPGGPVPVAAPPVPLEKLAPPDYDGIPIDLYHQARGAALRIARGCHWARCDFCHHVYPGYTEIHSSRPDDISDAYIESLLDHVEDIARRYGVDNLWLSDNGPPAALLHRFARALLARGTRIVWESLARFEPQLTDKVCADLARSGCRNLYFGLESSSPEELEASEKGIDLGLVESCLTATSRAGIGNSVFVLCHPRQGEGAYEQTLKWIQERFETVTQVITFRFLLSRFSRAYAKRRQLGLRLRRGASRNLDVFAVPFSSEHEMPLEAFMELNERCERELMPRQKAIAPMARGHWRAP